MEDRVLKAVGYRRVSMPEQLEGHSLEAQTVSIQQFAAQQGWQLLEIYTEPGLSAKKDSHRPELERLMSDAMAGRFDVVVVDKIDRFYRHLSGLLSALDQLHQYGVAFASVREKLDLTTPWGKLMLTVLGMLAEIYIDNLRQETQKGKHQRARQGLWNGSIALGYCNGLCSACTDSNGAGYCPFYGQPNRGNGKVPILHPIESEAVRLIFSLYSSGQYSDAKITRHLNTAFHVLPNGLFVPYYPKGTSGKTRPVAFTKDHIRGTLTRLLYTGKVPYFGKTVDGKSRKRIGPQEVYPGQHPAIIDEATFEAVQELRRLYATNPRSKRTCPVQVYPLTGLLYCAECGHRLRGISSHNIRYYRDVSQSEHVGHCSQPILRAEKIEAELVSLLKEELQPVIEETNLDELQVQANEAERRLECANVLYLNGAIDRATYEVETERHNTDKKALQTTKLYGIMQTIKELNCWPSFDRLQQKSLAYSIIERAYVRDGKVVAIQWPDAYEQTLMGCKTEHGSRRDRSK